MALTYYSMYVYSYQVFIFVVTAYIHFALGLYGPSS